MLLEQRGKGLPQLCDHAPDLALEAALVLGLEDSGLLRELRLKGGPRGAQGLREAGEEVAEAGVGLLTGRHKQIAQSLAVQGRVATAQRVGDQLDCIRNRCLGLRFDKPLPDRGELGEGVPIRVAHEQLQQGSKLLSGEEPVCCFSEGRRGWAVAFLLLSINSLARVTLSRNGWAALAVGLLRLLCLCILRLPDAKQKRPQSGHVLSEARVQPL